MATLRQDLIEAVTRAALAGSWEPTHAVVRDWLHSGGALCIAADHGLTRDEFDARMDRMDSRRFAAAARRAWLSEVARRTAMLRWRR